MNQMQYKKMAPVGWPVPKPTKDAFDSTCEATKLSRQSELAGAMKLWFYMPEWIRAQAKQAAFGVGELSEEALQDFAETFDARMFQHMRSLREQQE